MSHTKPISNKKERKNSCLLKFLEADHGVFTRSITSVLAWGGVLLISQSHTLAKDIATDAIKPRNFKRTFRRCAWYAKFGWPRWTYLADPFFTVTEGMDAHTLQALLRFWDRRSLRLPNSERSLERLCILGALIDATAQDSGQNRAQQTLFQTDLQTQMVELTDSACPLPETISTPTPRDVDHDFAVTDAITALSDFTRLLPPDTYRWFVMAGTFLGLYREQQFLPYDLDVDLGLYWNLDTHKTVLALCNASGDFDVQKVETQHTVPPLGPSETQVVLIKLIHRTGVSFDLFYHREEAGQLWHGSALHRWENMPFDLVSYDLHGVSVLGPKDGACYLTESYGDWQTPITNFDYNTQMSNLVWAPNFAGLAHTAKRLHLMRGKQNTALYASLLKRFMALPFLKK